MDKRLQQIALAELDGFNHLGEDIYEREDGTPTQAVPKYFSDEDDRHLINLCVKIANRNRGFLVDLADRFGTDLFKALPEQLAESMLRAEGKWRDGVSEEEAEKIYHGYFHA